MDHYSKDTSTEWTKHNENNKMIISDHIIPNDPINHENKQNEISVEINDIENNNTENESDDNFMVDDAFFRMTQIMNRISSHIVRSIGIHYGLWGQKP
eukprot:UN01674